MGEHVFVADQNYPAFCAMLGCGLHRAMPIHNQPETDRTAAAVRGADELNPVPDAGDDIAVRTVQLDLCDLCIRGEGGECHVPGCALWMNRAPDLPLDNHPSFKVLPDTPDAGDDTLRGQVIAAMTSVDVDGYQIGSALPARVADRVIDATADALLPRIREHVAEAWDEGYEVGCADTPWEDGATEGDRTPNPYREADHG